MPELRKCAMCGEPVLWVDYGFPIALDADPTCDGDVAVVAGSAILKDNWVDHERIYDGQYHTQHVATCRVLHPPKAKK